MLKWKYICINSSTNNTFTKDKIVNINNKLSCCGITYIG